MIRVSKDGNAVDLSWILDWRQVLYILCELCCVMVDRVTSEQWVVWWSCFEVRTNTDSSRRNFQQDFHNIPYTESYRVCCGFFAVMSMSIFRVCVIVNQPAPRYWTWWGQISYRFLICCIFFIWNLDACSASWKCVHILLMPTSPFWFSWAHSIDAAHSLLRSGTSNIWIEKQLLSMWRMDGQKAISPLRRPCTLQHILYGQCQ